MSSQSDGLGQLLDYAGLRQKEAEVSRFLGAVESAKGEKEKEQTEQIVDGLKLEVESLKSVLKANKKTIKDLQAGCVDNYVDGHGELREQATKKTSAASFPKASSRIEVPTEPLLNALLNLAKHEGLEIDSGGQS
ncbi:unnamed protein product [Ilex paraguariensis]|uniref:Uncharacterized protein n=1 Tax=Ilex paraguariensis TaxID=185542 RepID=A0ABC8SDT6_9AQUA